VVELADAPDSKSGVPREHAGSSPASGIQSFQQVTNQSQKAEFLVILQIVH
jgi:hypothetical protein